MNGEKQETLNTLSEAAIRLFGDRLCPVKVSDKR